MMRWSQICLSMVTPWLLMYGIYIPPKWDHILLARGPWQGLEAAPRFSLKRPPFKICYSKILISWSYLSIRYRLLPSLTVTLKCRSVSSSTLEAFLGGGISGGVMRPMLDKLAIGETLRGYTHKCRIRYEPDIFRRDLTPEFIFRDHNLSDDGHNHFHRFDILDLRQSSMAKTTHFYLTTLNVFQKSSLSTFGIRADIKYPHKVKRFSAAAHLAIWC